MIEETYWEDGKGFQQRTIEHEHLKQKPESDLKPCPFCAGEANFDTNTDKTRWFVYCTVCETTTNAKSRKETAQNFWNHRVG